MRSFVTSYNGLFAQRSITAPAVTHIEIPLIQRDYAQGREGIAVGRIRDNFLDVLHQAVTLDKSVSLDFVYGDVVEGVLRPLDGQQRLTTLFLLHWYLAVRADRLQQTQLWKQFSYATRPSARLFCERLVECQLPHEIDEPSAWIEDQLWYLFTWRHDPTIQSMLVMLDAMHERFRVDDCAAAWDRLVDPEQPAISFHLLPIQQMGLSEDLYIKMNSRGKPLTPFENFKAIFEQTLEASCPERVKEFAMKIDQQWSDVLWPYHGGDFIVDDEFLRYLEFVTELCEWREGRLETGSLDTRAERVFGSDNPRAAEHLDFLFQAFDTWVDKDIAAAFSDLLLAESPSLDSSVTNQVVLFGPQAGVDINLFADCCRSYGSIRGRNRVFGLPQTLLLYALLLHRIHETDEFPRRLRIVRNLVEASGNELRLEKMPALLEDVQRIVVDGTLEGIPAFNQAQTSDERLKAALIAMHPELKRALFQLEDQSLLRGSVAAFELEPATIADRADAFHQLFSDSSHWPALTGALLAVGDYSRQRKNSRFFQFGSGSNAVPWRELLTGVARSNLTRTRDVLMQVLDEVARSEGTLSDCLEAIQARFLQVREEAEEFDWRYYFVKYPAMRSGKSGIYVGSAGELGYSVCMLNKQRMTSYYRDPYLLAIRQESGAEQAVEDPWFTGYETLPRWMRLTNSGAELRCIEDGIAVRSPSNETHCDAFARVCEQHIVRDGILVVPQQDRDGRQIDIRDRVQLAAAFLRDLINARLFP